jgi:hypothetical protein
MTTYNDATGTSGITAFNSNNDSITIEYKNGSAYQYSEQVAGSANVGYMKTLAASGQGLNSFINKHLTKAQAVRVR